MYSGRYSIVLGLALIGATAAAHGWSLGDGLFLDDHWHRLQYESDAWSFRFLLDATTIEPERFVHMWWQDRPVSWHYIRPFSILFAKIVYHCTGGSVKSLHAASILLHLAGAFLVHHLCLRLTRRRFWSLVGALLFVVYSHSVYAVSWLAAQNVVLMTTLMLAALLCYARASGLNLYAGRVADGGSVSALISSRPRVPRMAISIFLGVLVLWCMAIGSRENAVVFPVFAVAFDLAFGGWRHLRARWGAYLVFFIIAAAFMWWRLVHTHHPMPDFYFRRPDGPAWLLWAIVKLMHYLTAAVWLSPLMFGPTLRRNPLTEVPADCLLMFTILAIMGIGYYLACRRARGYWIWPLWLLLAVLPVVPVMATPHSGYLPGVGFAVAMILGPALRNEVKPVSIGRWSAPVAIWFLIATITYVPIYRTMWSSVLAAERLTIARVAASPPDPEVTDLFFINLPFVNVYAKLHLGELWEQRTPDPRPSPASDLRCHVLTYSSNVLRMEQACRIRQLDAHQFSLAIPEGRPFFSGAMGRFLIEAMCTSGPPREGDGFDRPFFNVEIVRADDDGVRELVFRFHEPLASSKYCFYMTTPEHGALRLYFRRPEEASAPGDQERQPVFAASLERGQMDTEPFKEESATLRRQRDALFRIRAIAADIIRTDLYLTGPPFPGPR